MFLLLGAGGRRAGALAFAAAAGHAGGLRAWLREHRLDAFIVPSDDPHLSEYVADCFARREWISGFTGSAGTAVVCGDGALLWTDGRYFLQAEQELGSDWQLMRSGQPGVPSIKEHLTKSLPKGARVGVDPLVHSAQFATDLRSALKSGGMELVSVEKNPIDVMWGDDRPAFPGAQVRVHPLEYAGEDVPSKLKKLRQAMEEEGAEAIVICALDEIAYLFNIRGGDIECNPVTLSFAVVTRSGATLYVDSAKLSPQVAEHLTASGVTSAPYESALHAVQKLGEAESTVKVWVDPARTTAAFYEAVPEAKRVTTVSPIVLAKALKNDRELAGMREAHVRDGAAVAEFLHWLEGEVGGGGEVSEVEVDERLTAFRACRKGFLDVSFPTIAGADGNGAIIHYRARSETCGTVKRDSMLLLDSGGQYLDGTTDVTRTMHFGEPTAAQKAAFTRVLQGNIGIDTAVFPEGTPGFLIDSFARRALWAAGLDFGHGTGHGVGAALNVHEGPHSISPRGANSTPLKPGMIVSNEPGYYAAGEFGIRIENLLTVKETGMRNEALGKSFLGFEKLTLIPIQKKLINVDEMTPAELDWLDAYHATVWDIISPHVDGASGAKEWLREATLPIDRS